MKAPVPLKEAVPKPTETSLPPAVDEGTEAEERIPSAEPAANGRALDLNRIREGICAALNDKGHNTAAALLDAGKWSVEGGTIRVEVAAKKTMLGLTMNVEAEKIARDALRALGASQKLVAVPGENGATSPESKPRVVGGSVQAAALDNPLVKQAMELFGAEVRSVLDLRDTK